MSTPTMPTSQASPPDAATLEAARTLVDAARVLVFRLSSEQEPSHHLFEAGSRFAAIAAEGMRMLDGRKSRHQGHRLMAQMLAKQLVQWQDGQPITRAVAMRQLVRGLVEPPRSVLHAIERIVLDEEAASREPPVLADGCPSALVSVATT
jgi:hypothetical protein